MKTYASVVLAVLLTAPQWTVAQDSGGGTPGASAAPGKREASSQDDSPSYYRRIEIWATADGFLPNSVTVRQGQRVRLIVRRTTDESAPRDFVLDEFFVWLRLRPDMHPTESVAWGTAGTERVALGNVATELFAATRAGEFTFHTRDGKHSGRLVVEPAR
jgi:hypothetical protein